MKFLNKIILIFLVLITRSAFGLASRENEPALVYYDFQELSRIKNKIKSGEPSLVASYKKLIAQADGLLKVTPEKVTDGDPAPSGNNHDFFAIGKLAFPNPKTPDGMPYVRRDGVTNPEADGARYDLSRYNATLSRVNQLSMAWFFSGNEKYAAKASELLKVWFLDPETRMNPNFNNASALPGVYKGMPIGIIFGVALIKMVDHVKLLTGSKSWTRANDQSLRKWFDDYNTWLLESDLGIKEGAADNNHGSWYTAQVLAYAIYSGNHKPVKPMITLARKQINTQITKIGSMPKELTRQRSLHYSVYRLQAFTVVARCADYFGEDLWHYQTEDGRGLELAFQFLSPYILGEKEWTWTNIEKGIIPTNTIETFRWAEKKYPAAVFTRTYRHLYELLPPGSVNGRLTFENAK
jgi:hypothetical protein